MLKNWEIFAELGILPSLDKKEEKERKKPKKLTSQCITPTGIKHMAPLHFHFYINNCQLKLGVTPDIKATLEQELANSMFNETDHLFSL